MSDNGTHATFESVNDRLKEIVEAVSDEDMPLDEALELFDEAVALGMKASEMMEDDIAARDAADQEREDLEAAADAAADAELNAPASDYVPAWARSSMAQQATQDEAAQPETAQDEAAQPEVDADDTSDAAPAEPVIEIDAEADLDSEDF